MRRFNESRASHLFLLARGQRHQDKDRGCQCPKEQVEKIPSQYVASLRSIRMHMRPPGKGATSCPTGCSLENSGLTRQREGALF